MLRPDAPAEKRGALARIQTCARASSSRSSLDHELLVEPSASRVKPHPLDATGTGRHG